MTSDLSNKSSDKSSDDWAAEVAADQEDFQVRCPNSRVAQELYDDLVATGNAVNCPSVLRRGNLLVITDIRSEFDRIFDVLDRRCRDLLGKV
ncbi:hypothetical protein KKF04_04760, partial [Patescibacteria group bacterium]|nr:hypothetical protein [Patescibacteria group bacterium]